MRQQRLSPERRGRIFRYSFEAIVDEVRINVKFPCRIAVGWNYGTAVIYEKETEKSGRVRAGRSPMASHVSTRKYHLQQMSVSTKTRRNITSTK